MSVWVFCRYSHFLPKPFFKGQCLNDFVYHLLWHVNTFNYYQREFFGKSHCSRIICWDQGGELRRPPLVRLKMLFISLLLWWARWRSRWLELIFASLFFSFLYFRWLIFIHTFSREGVKGLPPVSTMLPTSSSRINYVSSTSFLYLMHCNEIQARNKPPQIKFMCCVNSFFICVCMSACVFYILLVWIWGPNHHICLTDEHIVAETSSAGFVQHDIPLTPVFILCCTAALSMWLGMLANRTVKEGKAWVGETNSGS